MGGCKKKIKYSAVRRGTVLIITMIFVVIFSALAVSMAALSNTNLQLSSGQHKGSNALSAAHSGLEVAKYIASGTALESTGYNYITSEQADSTWLALCQQLQTSAPGGVNVPAASHFTDTIGSGDQIETASINFASTGEDFSIRFYRYDSDSNTIMLQSTGSDGDYTRTAGLQMEISKDSQVMNYAIASRGRLIVTGNSTIDGPIFSTWNKPSWHPPLETTSETFINGTINTVLTLQELQDAGIQMENLDANDNPVFDEYGNRVYSEDDAVQGYHEGINYGETFEAMPGMNSSDYDTSMYESMCTEIPASSLTSKEYFPHMSGNYDQQKEFWNYTYYRNVYENQTFTNARLPVGRNALFRNCTFEEVLFIGAESNTGRKSKCNNVRFQDCQFNGIIVTNVPENTNFKWVQNCLYFTGESYFNNTSSIQEATILAPNFNVNLGNTAEVESGAGNILTGAVIGGIVDVRGNAQIQGTIISTYDASKHNNGYVTNIGFAEDGGSEGGVPEDIGTIHITPTPDQLLPNGVQSPIVIKVLKNTYSEFN